jgi:hypothetical protein
MKRFWYVQSKRVEKSNNFKVFERKKIKEPKHDIFSSKNTRVPEGGGRFYWWRKPEYTEKTTNLWQVTDMYKRIHEFMYVQKYKIFSSHENWHQLI